MVFIWISLAPLPEALQDARKRSEEMLMPSGEIFVKNRNQPVKPILVIGLILLLISIFSLECMRLNIR